MATTTLNRRCKQRSNEAAELEFNLIRDDYLKDLEKLRKKYASKLAKFAATYSDAYLYLNKE